MNLKDKNILLIISGGIAAYKSLDLIRELKRSGAHIKTILTKSGSEFVTPLSVSALSGDKCYTDLWDLTDETEMGHITLARKPDLIVIAPATANIMAKMAHGLADDLASTCLLATDKPIMIAPAMNPHMWNNVATQDNVKILKSRGIEIIYPDHGEMACGEIGQGRMADLTKVLNHIDQFFNNDKPLHGYKALVTAGPTYEPIDPVRFIGNRSSGKQGYAIAQSLHDAGADVTLISGPTYLPPPQGMTVVSIETAKDMMQAVEQSMPTDIAICAAAVADYGVQKHASKQKKKNGDLDIQLTDNPDILHTIATHKNRPQIVVGFAAETDNVIANARIKLQSKHCDLIIANAVGGDINPVFGSDNTSVTFITDNDEISHDHISKSDVAQLLVSHIIRAMNRQTKDKAA
jgi:phosphopantothenoylcysteine decarboxylase/phosphopantothenate--cysteine ligase